MKGNRAALAAVVAVVLLVGAAGGLFKRGSAARVDRSDRQLPTAEKQPPTGTFQVIDVT